MLSQIGNFTVQNIHARFTSSYSVLISVLIKEGKSLDVGTSLSFMICIRCRRLFIPGSNLGAVDIYVPPLCANYYNAIWIRRIVALQQKLIHISADTRAVQHQPSSLSDE